MEIGEISYLINFINYAGICDHFHFSQLILILILWGEDFCFE